jgi:hypothetical protein
MTPRQRALNHRAALLLDSCRLDDDETPLRDRPRWVRYQPALDALCGDVDIQLPSNSVHFHRRR